MNVKAIKTDTAYILPVDNASYEQLVKQVSEFVDFGRGQAANDYRARMLLKSIGIDPKRRKTKARTQKALVVNDPSTTQTLGERFEDVCEKHHGCTEFDHDDDDEDYDYNDTW